MDSEDIRVTNGEIKNASMSSAASVSSSCSSAGIGDGDNAPNKQFSFNGEHRLLLYLIMLSPYSTFYYE